MDDRKLEVLRAIVSDYVQTREPVGSKALVERHRLDVSPATIRNDMAVLEDEGYLIQPHTSAGRIPTDKGYRLFVDRLTTIKPLSGAERRPSPRSWPEQPASMTSSIGQCGCWPRSPNGWPSSNTPTARSTTIRHVELVSLHLDRALLILIDSTGRIDQRSLSLPSHTDTELDGWRDRLNRAVIGLTPEKADEALNELFEEPVEVPARGVIIIDALRAMPERRPIQRGGGGRRAEPHPLRRCLRNCHRTGAGSTGGAGSVAAAAR